MFTFVPFDEGEQLLVICDGGRLTPGKNRLTTVLFEKRAEHLVIPVQVEVVLERLLVVWSREAVQPFLCNSRVLAVARARTGRGFSIADRR